MVAQRQRVDVCILGDGPAGIATALALARQGRRITLLRREPQPARWGGESFTGAIRDPLTQLGLWPRFLQASHVPGYECRTAWGGVPREDSTLFRREGHFWHVDRAHFDDDLRLAAVEAGVRLSTYRTLDTVSYDAQGQSWTVHLDARQTVEAAYIVDATGRRRALARRLGTHAQSFDRLIAYTASLPRNANAEYAHAMVLETTPDGWWYAAPVPSGHILAFFTDHDLAPSALPPSMRRVSANSVYAQSLDDTRWVTVGDACAAHDPLCGWGVHRALTNGIRAAEALDEDLREHSTRALNAYRRYCRDQFEAYLDGLIVNYRLETRWDTPFWRRRTDRELLLT